MQQQVGSNMTQPQFTFEGGHLVMFHDEVTGLQAKDSNVNDRDRMQDLLSTQKYLSDGYDKAMNEASHDALWQVFQQNHQNTKQLERQIFNTMFKKGWYKLPVADAQSVAWAHNQFSQYRTQFPFPSQIQQVSSNMQMTGTQSQQQSGMQAGGTTGGTDQQLQQKVNQALSEAERGKVPTGYAGARSH
ncbi:MAG TPA: spore coat protein [Symbiobacteriaceae bacterium]|nr:spore coat protein [Symbiobacteriaceae bacterium]